jgi:hypothetical protein
MSRGFSHASWGEHFKERKKPMFCFEHFFTFDID